MTADRSIVTYPTSAFDYDLPAELIAQEPVAERGGSRLLVVRRGDGTTNGGTTNGGTTGRRDDGTFVAPASLLAGGLPAAPAAVPNKSPVPSSRRPVVPPNLADRMFSDLPALIPPGDLLVLNSTRVRHARFIGTRPSGAPAEVLLLHPGTDDTWLAMGKPGSALRPGKQVSLGDGVAIETLAVLDDGNRVVRFVGCDAATAIARFGRLPLPPYIHRAADARDEMRYQTVYAEREGSVAAPTAGLHFTADILNDLQRRGVRLARLDLEVGPGTFKPVDTEDPTDHLMHAEQYVIPVDVTDAIDATRAAGGAVWAVGTTVVRALESAADDSGRVRSGAAETTLLITPGYRFRVVDRLLTNFHLPRSTLLMLVSAFAGYERTMAAYRHAVQERYRFYSYGDAMVIL